MGSARRAGAARRKSGTRQWHALLPWHEPERQGVTSGWWGWFPNIPRNPVGRACWVLLVGTVAAGFLALLIVLLGAALNGSVLAGPQASGILGFVLSLALLALGFLIFTWHLIAGIALAQTERREARLLRAQLLDAEQRVRAARARLRGRP